MKIIKTMIITKTVHCRERRFFELKHTNTECAAEFTHKKQPHYFLF